MISVELIRQPSLLAWLVNPVGRRELFSDAYGVGPGLNCYRLTGDVALPVRRNYAKTLRPAWTGLDVLQTCSKVIIPQGSTARDDEKAGLTDPLGRIQLSNLDFAVVICVRPTSALGA